MRPPRAPSSFSIDIPTPFQRMNASLRLKQHESDKPSMSEYNIETYHTIEETLDVRRSVRRINPVVPRPIHEHGPFRKQQLPYMKPTSANKFSPNKHNTVQYDDIFLDKLTTTEVSNIEQMSNIYAFAKRTLQRIRESFFSSGFVGTCENAPATLSTKEKRHLELQEFRLTLFNTLHQEFIQHSYETHKKLSAFFNSISHIVENRHKELMNAVTKFTIDNPYDVNGDAVERIAPLQYLLSPSPLSRSQSPRASLFVYKTDHMEPKFLTPIDLRNTLINEAAENVSFPKHRSPTSSFVLRMRTAAPRRSTSPASRLVTAVHLSVPKPPSSSKAVPLAETPVPPLYGARSATRSCVRDGKMGVDSALPPLPRHSSGKRQGASILCASSPKYSLRAHSSVCVSPRTDAAGADASVCLLHATESMTDAPSCATNNLVMELSLSGEQRPLLSQSPSVSVGSLKETDAPISKYGALQPRNTLACHIAYVRSQVQPKPRFLALPFSTSATPRLVSPSSRSTNESPAIELPSDALGESEIPRESFEKGSLCTADGHSTMLDTEEAPATVHDSANAFLCSAGETGGGSHDSGDSLMSRSLDPSATALVSSYDDATAQDVLESPAVAEQPMRASATRSLSDDIWHKIEDDPQQAVLDEDNPKADTAYGCRARPKYTRDFSYTGWLISDPHIDIGSVLQCTTLWPDFSKDHESDRLLFTDNVEELLVAEAKARANAADPYKQMLRERERLQHNRPRTPPCLHPRVCNRRRILSIRDVRLTKKVGKLDVVSFVQRQLPWYAEPFFSAYTELKDLCDTLRWIVMDGHHPSWYIHTLKEIDASAEERRLQTLARDQAKRMRALKRNMEKLRRRVLRSIEDASAQPETILSSIAALTPITMKLADQAGTKDSPALLIDRPAATEAPATQPKKSIYSTLNQEQERRNANIATVEIGDDMDDIVTKQWDIPAFMLETSPRWRLLHGVQLVSSLPVVFENVPELMRMLNNVSIKKDVRLGAAVTEAIAHYFADPAEKRWRQQVQDQARLAEEHRLSSLPKTIVHESIIIIKNEAKKGRPPVILKSKSKVGAAPSSGLAAPSHTNAVSPQPPALPASNLLLATPIVDTRRNYKTTSFILSKLFSKEERETLGLDSLPHAEDALNLDFLEIYQKLIVTFHKISSSRIVYLTNFQYTKESIDYHNELRSAYMVTNHTYTIDPTVTDYYDEPNIKRLPPTDIALIASIFRHKCSKKLPIALEKIFLKNLPEDSVDFNERIFSNIRRFDPSDLTPVQDNSREFTDDSLYKDPADLIDLEDHEPLLHEMRQRLDSRAYCDEDFDASDAADPSTASRSVQDAAIGSNPSLGGRLTRDMLARFNEPSALPAGRDDEGHPVLNTVAPPPAPLELTPHTLATLGSAVHMHGSQPSALDRPESPTGSSLVRGSDGSSDGYVNRSSNRRSLLTSNYSSYSYNTHTGLTSSAEALMSKPEDSRSEMFASSTDGSPAACSLNDHNRSASSATPLGAAVSEEPSRQLSAATSSGLQSHSSLSRPSVSLLASARNVSDALQRDSASDITSPPPNQRLPPQSASTGPDVTLTSELQLNMEVMRQYRERQGSDRSSQHASSRKLYSDMMRDVFDDLQKGALDHNVRANDAFDLENKHLCSTMFLRLSDTKPLFDTLEDWVSDMHRMLFLDARALLATICGNVYWVHVGNYAEALRTKLNNEKLSLLYKRFVASFRKRQSGVSSRILYDPTISDVVDKFNVFETHRWNGVRFLKLGNYMLSETIAECIEHIVCKVLIPFITDFITLSLKEIASLLELAKVVAYLTAKLQREKPSPELQLQMAYSALEIQVRSDHIKIIEHIENFMSHVFWLFRNVKATDNKVVTTMEAHGKYRMPKILIPVVNGLRVSWNLCRILFSDTRKFILNNIGETSAFTDRTALPTFVVSSLRLEENSRSLVPSWTSNLRRSIKASSTTALRTTFGDVPKASLLTRLCTNDENSPYDTPNTCVNTLSLNASFSSFREHDCLNAIPSFASQPTLRQSVTENAQLSSNRRMLSTLDSSLKSDLFLKSREFRSSCVASGFTETTLSTTARTSADLPSASDGVALKHKKRKYAEKKLFEPNMRIVPEATTGSRVSTIDLGSRRKISPEALREARRALEDSMMGSSVLETDDQYILLSQSTTSDVAAQPGQPDPEMISISTITEDVSASQCMNASASHDIGLDISLGGECFSITSSTARCSASGTFLPSAYRTQLNVRGYGYYHYLHENFSRYRDIEQTEKTARSFDDDVEGISDVISLISDDENFIMEYESDTEDGEEASENSYEYSYDDGYYYSDASTDDRSSTSPSASVKRST